MSISDELLNVLACPEDKGPLLYLEEVALLYNPRLKRQYKIVDGIPVMLLEEAETLQQDAHDELMAQIDGQEGPGSTTAP